jgi:hypothetical protein
MNTNRPHHLSKHDRHNEASDGGYAFIPDVARSHNRLKDDFAESFAEEFIASVTSGEFVGEDARNEMSAEERGGPFLQLLANSGEGAFDDDGLDDLT